MASGYSLLDPIELLPPEKTGWRVAYLKETKSHGCTVCGESSHNKRDIRSHWRVAEYEGNLKRYSKPVTLQTWISTPQTRYWMIQSGNETIPTVGEGPILAAA